MAAIVATVWGGHAVVLFGTADIPFEVRHFLARLPANRGWRRRRRPGRRAKIGVLLQTITKETLIYQSQPSSLTQL
ncbi:hypothetical protein, partial [Ralstonia solanacearum]